MHTVVYKDDSIHLETMYEFLGITIKNLDYLWNNSEKTCLQ